MLQAPIAPTVKDSPNFNAEKDVEELRKALQGKGADEQALIKIICKRSNAQRQVIIQKYNTMHKRNLIEDIKAGTSGDFQKLMLALLYPPIDFICSKLRDAIAKKDSEAVIDLLSSLNPVETRKVESYFNTTYSSSLPDDLGTAFPTNFVFLLVALFAEDRDGSDTVNPEKAKEQIESIIGARFLGFAADDLLYSQILGHSNPKQVKVVLEQYKKINGVDMEEDIKKRFSGIFKNALLAFCDCALDTAGFYAAQLRKSMKGLGTNDEQLIRIMTMRSEVDLQAIKDSFNHKYKGTLEQWIKDDTSGHYRDGLLALL